MMAYGRERKPRGWVRSVLVVVGIFILLIFVVDKLVARPGPGAASHGNAAAATLAAPRRPAGDDPYLHRQRGTKDGTTFSASLPADRDLGPALRESGAEVVVLSGRTAPEPSSSPLAVVFQFVPYVIMALLLFFIVRRLSPRGTR